MADGAKNDSKDKQDKLKKDQETEKIKTENIVNSASEPVEEHNTNINSNMDADNPETAETNTNSATQNQVKSEEKEKNKPKTKRDAKGETKTDKGKEGKVAETVPAEAKHVQAHYKMHAKSTLPHILTEYGLQDKDQPVVKIKEPEKKKKKKKKRVENVSDSEEEDRARRKAREEHLRRNFGDGRVADSYYREYIDFLEQKVVQQRQKAAREKEEAERLRLLRLEEESEPEETKKAPEVPSAPVPEKQRHHFARRLERVELKHDDSFLKNLPKTDMARIIELQDRLKREGKLKTQYDVDNFWSDIRKPDVFYKHFKVNKKDAGLDDQPTAVDSTVGSKEMDQKEPDIGLRSLSHISEASRDKETWAITQKYQSTHGPKTPTEKKRKDSAQMAKDAALDLERRCPKLEMPPLACFSLKFGEKPPEPEEITRKLTLKSREKERKKLQRKINKMYQMAMTNTAAANRILAQHKDLTDIFEGAALRDVRNFCCEPTRVVSELSELAVFDEPYPTIEDYYWDITDPSRAIQSAPQPEQLSLVSRSQPSTRQSSAASRKLTPISDKPSRTSSKSRKKKTPEMIEYPVPLPLSLDEVTRQENTIEAKCTSTFWTNYMHAGKSAFAHA